MRPAVRVRVRVLLHAVLLLAVTAAAAAGSHARTSRPILVFAATAARSMSPVARWHRQCSLLITGDCVPLPQPGGPAASRQQPTGSSGVVLGMLLTVLYARGPPRRAARSRQAVDQASPMRMRCFLGLLVHSSRRCSSFIRSPSGTSVRSVGMVSAADCAEDAAGAAAAGLAAVGRG